MKISINRLVIAAAIAGLSIANLAHSSIAAAAPINPSAHSAVVQSHARPDNAGLCSANLSAEELTPNQVYVVSGAFLLVSQSTPTRAACVQLARQAYNYQVNQSGWDPASVCTREQSQVDTFFVYMTYTWNNGPSTRVDGYAHICDALTPVIGVNTL